MRLALKLGLSFIAAVVSSGTTTPGTLDFSVADQSGLIVILAF